MSEYNPSIELNSRGLLCSPGFVERRDLVRTANSFAVSLTDIYEKKVNQYNTRNIEYRDDDSESSSSSAESIPLSRSFKKTLSSLSIFSKSSRTQDKPQEKDTKKKDKNYDYMGNLKSFSKHIGQCTMKALSIPAVILLDIIGNIVG